MEFNKVVKHTLFIWCRRGLVREIPVLKGHTRDKVCLFNEVMRHTLEVLRSGHSVKYCFIHMYSSCELL